MATVAVSAGTELYAIGGVGASPTLRPRPKHRTAWRVAGLFEAKGGRRERAGRGCGSREEPAFLDAGGGPFPGAFAPGVPEGGEV